MISGTKRSSFFPHYRVQSLRLDDTSTLSKPYRDFTKKCAPQSEHDRRRVDQGNSFRLSTYCDHDLAVSRDTSDIVDWNGGR